MECEYDLLYRVNNGQNISLLLFNVKFSDQCILQSLFILIKKGKVFGTSTISCNEY